MKQSVYTRNHESLVETAVARRPGMHSHGGPWERCAAAHQWILKDNSPDVWKLEKKLGSGLCF